MAPPPSQNTATSDSHTTGSLITGFLGIVVLVCLLCLLYVLRSRARKRVENWSNASFLRSEMAKTNLSSPSAPPPFSRILGMTPSIVMPEKTITRKSYSHGLSNKTLVSPRLLSPASSTPSFQRPLMKASFRPGAMSILNPAHSRHSKSSSRFSTYSPNHPPSGVTRLSRSSVFPLQPRPVHQLFEPALPDELALTRYGEGLSVLQSFDDGWCLVTRVTSDSFRASRLFASDGDKADSDVGIVPAWVFTEPIQGSNVTRPFRNSSINALRLVQNPVDARNAVISWSFFG